MASASKGGRVGKYLKSRNTSKAKAATGDHVAVAVGKSSKKRKVGDFSDFSGW